MSSAIDFDSPTMPSFAAASRGEVHERAAFLLAEQPRCGVRDIERAHQMNLDDGLEGVDAHAMEDRIAQDAGIVDHAVHPRFLISSTTSSAGVALDPEPSAAPPGSLTTTLAPSAAQSSAISRPMPRPAPVTMMDLPSSDLVSAMMLLCPVFLRLK